MGHMLLLSVLDEPFQRVRCAEHRHFGPNFTGKE
jgi:hypothetical protein